MQVGDFEQAAQWFDKILLQQVPLEGSQYVVMGTLAQMQGNYEKAEQLFQTAYDAPGNSPIELITINFSLGMLARLRGNIDKAGNYLQQGIRIATEYNLPEFVSRGHWYLGELMVASGDFQSALAYFPNDELVVWYATGSPGWAHLGLENLDEAKEAFEKSLQKMVVSHTRPLGLHALVGMAHLHARAGDMRRALQLLALVRHHHACTFEAKEKAKELWIELVAELPEEVVTEAERTGQTLDLFAVVKALLANDDDVDSWSATANLDQISDARRYKPGELLAEGGHGQVYLGQDSETGQAVVIKQLKPELQERDDLVARFLRESEALSQLNHPNIVQMVDAFEENGRHHIVLEYVAGGSLRDLLEKNGQLPQIQCLDIALELADALSRAHHLGILHRDLKPGNVLLAADGTPRLTDFGIARLVQEDAKLTATGSVLGSPAYMSSEAVLGETFDHRGDIWSFGVLLYEMLAGKRPFASEPLTAVLAAILNDPVPAIEQFNPDIHPDLAALLAHMLHKSPENRPESMRQIAATLEAIRKEVG